MSITLALIPTPCAHCNGVALQVQAFKVTWKSEGLMARPPIIRLAARSALLNVSLRPDGSTQEMECDEDTYLLDAAG